jgi:glyoxylase-like metal-dependent hydrolase (beta-lactamase superfamily II)
MSLFLPATAAQARPEAAGVASFQVGSVTVFAIADSTGDRDMSVFTSMKPAPDPDVLRRFVPSGRTPSAILAFVLKFADSCILIDAGLGNDQGGERASLLMERLRQAGIMPGDIASVLLTHMHGDHIGGLIWKGEKAFPNANVLVNDLEAGFWLDKEQGNRFPANKAGFALAESVMPRYGESVKTFAFGELAPFGLTALDARGHTPGHTAFMLESEGSRMLFWGDLVHAAALQFPRPDISSVYDMDPARAAAVRAEMMETAAARDIPVAGAHLPFPGVGRVRALPGGGYQFVPGL